MSSIPDGPPIPMSEFTLGKRYSSEDMYRDYPDLVPGSHVTFEKDGVLYTDTVHSFTTTGATLAIYADLSRWQRMLRRLTPRRWRRPLLIREAKPETVTVGTGESDNPVKRTLATIERINATVEKLLRP